MTCAEWGCLRATCALCVSCNAGSLLEAPYRPAGFISFVWMMMLAWCLLLDVMLHMAQTPIGEASRWTFYRGTNSQIFRDKHQIYHADESIHWQKYMTLIITAIMHTYQQLTFFIWKNFSLLKMIWKWTKNVNCETGSSCARLDEVIKFSSQVKQ